MDPTADLNLTLDQQHHLLAISLTQRHAKQVFLDSVSLQLQRERRRHTRSQRAWGFLLALSDPGALYAGLAGGLLLLCAGGTGCEAPSAFSAGVGSGWLGALLLALGVANGCIVARERHLASIESIRRVELWLSRVAQQNSLFRGSIRTASSHTLHVMRDGMWLSLHPNLLVHGDVILLRPGDATPGAVASALPVAGGTPRSVAAGNVYMPSSTSPSEPNGGSAGVFILQEDVAAMCVAALFGRQTALSSSRQQRNPTPLAKQIREVTGRLLHLAALLAVQAAALQAIAYVVWTSEGRPAPPLSGFLSWIVHVFVPHAVALGLPLLPLALPVFVAVAEAYAASHLTAALTGMPLSESGTTGAPTTAGGGESGDSGHAAPSWWQRRRRNHTENANRL